jgi:nicotinamidase-related amidase
MKPMNPRLHSISRSLVVVVDIQQKLVPVIPDRESIISSTRLLLDVAAVLNVPAMATEQYPKGLGTTVPELAEHAALKATIEKLRFSACEAIQQSNSLSSINDRHVVLTGIETHICILQTAMDLLELGCGVTLVVDATGSRRSIDQQTALRRMESAGVVLATAESIVFEWCEVAGTDAFKSISRLVRDRT